MSSLVDPADPWAESDVPEDIQVLSAEEARVLEQRHPPLNLWRVLLWQAGVAAVALVLVILIWHRIGWLASAAAGALAVLLPQLLLVWKVGRKVGQLPAAAWLVQLFMWEMIKLVLTLALLLLAMRLIEDRSWPLALLVFVVTIKAAWLAAWLQMRKAGHND